MFVHVCVPASIHTAAEQIKGGNGSNPNQLWTIPTTRRDRKTWVMHLDLSRLNFDCTTVSEKKSRMNSFPEIFLAVYQLHELCKLIYSKHLTEDNWGERNVAPRNRTCASSMNGSTSEFLCNIYTSELVVKCLSFNFSQQALVKTVENSFKCTINSTLKGPGFQKMLGASPVKTITHVGHSEMLTSFETLGPI